VITLNKLKVESFTVFDKSEFFFGSRLNVIIGENGSGKTHLLKLLYALVHNSFNSSKTRTPRSSKTKQQQDLAEDLINVFRPDSLGRLVRRQQGRNRASVAIDFNKTPYSYAFSFATNSHTEVQLDKLSSKFLPDAPVYLPPRELLSIFPGFVSLYESRHLELEQTWYDTCLLLGEPALRGPRATAISKLIEPIEQVMGGTVFLDNSGRFYLRIPGIGNIEMHLLAEGLRKFAMIARLIVTGTLFEKGYLFWDEPEANLNPRLIKAAAKLIVELVKSGVQIFIATHNLFLLRELEILLAQSDEIPAKGCQYISLYLENGVSRSESASSLSHIKTIVALDESLQQSDRYLNMARSK